MQRHFQCQRKEKGEAMEELLVLKGSIEAAQQGQLAARKEFATKFAGLGYSLYSAHKFPHPSEEGKFVYIWIQDCMNDPKSTFDGFFYVEVKWYISCEEAGCEEYHCDDAHTASRPATAEEVIGALKKDLMDQAETEWKEVERDNTLAAALPSEEELAKIRRQVEDAIRKDKKMILPIAKLLDVI